jgi:uncharacterized radical SAM protein YgiQ
MSREEMARDGYEKLDFLLITGDAYVDHPSFGAALIGRVLQSAGYSVGVISQPNWREIGSFKVMGKPSLGVLITAGNLDSLVANYTAAGKPRRRDDFSSGGVGGQRPDRATIVYANKAREAFGSNIPIILGGVEASLRRLAHYDYWSDRVRRSILVDSKADLLLYGMAEFSMLEVAGMLKRREIDYAKLKGACYQTVSPPPRALHLPSYDDVASSKEAFAQAFKMAYLEQDPITGRMLCQKHGETYVVSTSPPMPLNMEQMDWIYSIPFTRRAHARYAQGIKALEEVEFSITSHRGCFGSCSFCALTAHQGRLIQRRSLDSILAEARLLTSLPGFKGFIHDIGGPTANFHVGSCTRQGERGACRGKQCLSPEPCEKLHVDHSEYLSVLRAVRQLPKVRKVFVRSGVRYDYALMDEDDSFMKELCQYHVSGQLKVAPEHISNRVLRLMGKPPRQTYERFVQKYLDVNHRLGKEQYIVPYFMSSHPGSTLKDAIELAEYFRDKGIRPEQVQDFIPTPGSLSTCMYHTGLHPLTGEKVYVPRSQKEKQAQRALLQYYLPKNQRIVHEALTKAGRTDLIGYGPRALVRPLQGGQSPERGSRKGDKKPR